MSRLRSLIPVGNFGRGVAVLAGGTAFGQALTILASPVLTRLYGPADFGALAVYTSMLGIAGALAALSYHQAIPLPEGDDDAAQVLGLSLILTVLVAGLVAVAVVLGGSRLVKFLDAPALVPYLWMIPLGVLGLTAYEVLTQWAVRRRTFPAIARTAVARGAAQTGTQLGLGFAGFGSFGLLLGQLLAQWVGSGSLLRRAFRESRMELRGITASGMRVAASRFSRFPRYMAPSVLLNVAGMHAPALLLSYFFGPIVTGFYALGARILMMPVSLIAKSASQVFFASAPGYLREGRLGTEVEVLFRRMLRLTLAPVLIIAVSAPALFAVIFGEEWREAGVYLAWLAPWALFMFTGTTLSPLISVLGLQRAGLFFQASLTIVRFASIIAGGFLNHPLTAIALYGVSSGICWAVYLYWLLSDSGVRFGTASRISLASFMTALLPAAPAAGCAALSLSDLATSGAAVAGGMAAVVWAASSK